MGDYPRIEKCRFGERKIRHLQASQKKIIFDFLRNAPNIKEVNIIAVIRMGNNLSDGLISWGFKNGYYDLSIDNVGRKSYCAILLSTMRFERVFLLSVC